MKPQVAIIMGSNSDLKIMEGAVEALKEFGIPTEIKVVSAHRTPEKMVSFAKNAQKNGFKVIIAGAGGAAHLPGMVASLTTLPVIGVPINITAMGMNGIDSFLSIVQMPKGVPVATMAIDNAWNAGLYAVRILGIKNQRLQKKLKDFEKNQKEKVRQMNLDLKSMEKL